MTIRIQFTGETREDIVFQIADLLKLPAEALTTVLAAEPAAAAAAAPAKAKTAAAAKAAATAAAINGTGGVLDNKPAAAAAAPAKESSLLDDDEAAPEEKPVTLDVLKKALVQHISRHTEKVTSALMKKIGKADKISKLDPKHYNALYQAVTAEL
jgi:hypothetical protein